MCRAFNTSPGELLSNEAEIRTAVSHISFNELTQRIKKHMDAHGMTVAEFEDKVGWDLETLLHNPEGIWGRDVEFLIGVCSELGMEWLSVLPA